MTFSAVGLSASLFMGLVLGLTGGGGSILTVPILVYLFGVTALMATGYSLVIVGGVAVWGAYKAYKQNELNLMTLLSFGVPSTLGVVVSRKLVLPSIPESIKIFDYNLNKDAFLLVIFATLMIAASVSMMLNARQSRGISQAEQELQDPAKLFSVSASLSGFAVGLLSGFVGAGGGFLIIPFLVQFQKVPMKIAIGTSLGIIAMQSLIGVSSDTSVISQMNALLLFSVMSFSLVGMTLGTKLRNKLAGFKLKIAFAVFVLVVALLILFKELF